MLGPCLIMQYILFSFATISLKVKDLVAVYYILSVFCCYVVLVVCVSPHGAVGWSAVCDSGHIHLLLGCMWRYRTVKSCVHA